MFSKTIAAILTAAALGLAAAAQAQPARPLFLFIYSPGPAWKPGVPVGQQALAPHGKYMASLAADGRLVAGGPLTDADGGVAVISAPDAAAARAILAADPSIQAGIMKAEIHGWTPMFGTDDGLTKRR